MDSAQKKFLENKAYNLRVSSLMATAKAGSGHPTSCLSAADIVAALFFYAMRYDMHEHSNPNNDRFILSKGHAAPVLYAVYKELGVVSQEELMTLRQFDSALEGHPTPRFMYNEAATGSLGQGLSVGAGMAYAAKMDKRDYTTYVLLGDSEVAEGSVWEAAELAAFYKLDNLVGILDCNGLGQSTETMYDHQVEPYVRKFQAFGWRTLVVNGHDVAEVCDALASAQHRNKTPVMIIAKTIKGYGLEHVQGKQGFHGKAFQGKEEQQALDELHDAFAPSADNQTGYVWKSQVPKREHAVARHAITLPQSSYKKGEMLATRKAYGQALALLGDCDSTVVALDAEVKNSTYADIFEKKHKDRFVQCFIAEQNMVGMAVGMSARGKVPFAATFACFFSRAYDQIRMAAIGRIPLRLVGSHAGVSIGQDGPSQMGLEDIAMMRALIGSVILYPCDAVSAHALVGLMANYNAGISYLRTTRAETPVLYGNNEQFVLGGCKVLRQEPGKDVACVIAAGITVHEALKAYEVLRAEGISSAVIDLYSVKPLDYETVLAVVRASGKRVITVEDHYREGGLGEAVTYALRNDAVTITCLAVAKMPRSGAPEELMAYEGIDAAAIVEAIRDNHPQKHSLHASTT